MGSVVVMASAARSTDGPVATNAAIFVARTSATRGAILAGSPSVTRMTISIWVNG